MSSLNLFGLDLIFDSSRVVFLIWSTTFLYRYLISLILLLKLMTRVNLLPPRLKDLQFHRFLKNGKGLNICSIGCLFFWSSRLKYDHFHTYQTEMNVYLMLHIHICQLFCLGNLFAALFSYVFGTKYWSYNCFKSHSLLLRFGDLMQVFYSYGGW